MPSAEAVGREGSDGSMRRTAPGTVGCLRPLLGLPAGLSGALTGAAAPSGIDSGVVDSGELADGLPKFARASVTRPPPYETAWIQRPDGV